MKRFCCLFIVLFSVLLVYSQGTVSFRDKDFVYSTQRDSNLDSILSNQLSYQQLSSEEKDVIYWINYVRKKPSVFYHEVLASFLTQFPEIKSSYSRSLTADLLNSPSLPILIPSGKLNTVASKHATDLGSTGSRISHNSSRGTSFQERMNQEGLTNCIAENIYEGRKDALESVIFLLIDQGVPNLGHRKNILSKSNNLIGVSFHAIKGRSPSFFLVQNFSCE